MGNEFSGIKKACYCQILSFSYFSTQVVLTAKSNEITNVDKTILDICRD